MLVLIPPPGSRYLEIFRVQGPLSPCFFCIGCLKISLKNDNNLARIEMVISCRTFPSCSVLFIKMALSPIPEAARECGTY